LTLLISLISHMHSSNSFRFWTEYRAQQCEYANVFQMNEGCTKTTCTAFP